MENRIPSGLLLRAYFGLFLSLTAGFSAVVMLALLFNDLDSIEAKRLFAALSTVLLFLLPALLWRFKFRASMPDGGELRGVRVLLCGLLAMLFTIPVAGLLAGLSSRLPWPAWVLQMEELSNQEVLRFLSQSGWVPLLSNLICLAAVPAICEEMFFRGALQRLLQTSFSNAKSTFLKEHLPVLLCAAIFSLAHFSLVGFAPRFAHGLILGYIFLYTGNLRVSMTMHFMNNALAIIVEMFRYSDSLEHALFTWMGWGIGLVSLLLLLVAILCARRMGSH